MSRFPGYKISIIRDYNVFQPLSGFCRLHDLIVDKAQGVTISSSGGFNMSRVKYFRYFEISRSQELMMSRLQAIRFSIPLTFSSCSALGSPRCQGLASSRLSYVHSAETYKYSDFPKAQNGKQVRWRCRDCETPVCRDV